MMARFRYWTGWLGSIVVLAYLLGFTMMPLRISAPNERSRLYLTVALFEHQSFQIDAERLRFGRLYDEARFGGHYYTDKAPGASLVALPVYAAYRALVPRSSVTNEHLLILGRYAVMLPVSIVGFCALTALAQALGLRRREANLVAWTALVATPSFHYAAAFFGHHLVAVAWTLSLLLLIRAEPWRGMRAHVAAVAFGALLGFAQLIEYQALLGTVTLFGLYLWTFRRRLWRVLFALLAGALPCAIWLGYYHSRSFGGVFELSYHHLTSPALAAIHSQGTGGVLWPNFERLWGTLFSFHRGLLVTSPCLALFPLGLWGLVRRGRAAWAVALFVMVAAYVVFMASSLTWEAGWGYGPRLLLPVIPLVVLLVGCAMMQYGRATWFWAILGTTWLSSLLGVQVVTTFFPEPPSQFKNPLFDVAFVLAQAGVSVPHRALGFDGYWFLVLIGLLLFPFGLLGYVAFRSSGSWRWSWALPIAPLLIAGAVGFAGPSVGRDEQAEFVRFVRSTTMP